MNIEKWKSVAKGAAIAAAGAGLAYLTAWSASADIGLLGPILTAGLSVAVNAVRKWAEPTPAA
jgi:hypothetical protein